MTGTAVHEDRAKRRRNGADDGPVLVSGHKLAGHLFISRQHVERLTAQGVFERLPSGLFDQDQARCRYMAHLRSERQRSSRSAADREHVRAKSEMLRIKIAEKQRRLVPLETYNEMIDSIAGIVLTALSGMAVRRSRDLVVRRNIETVVIEVRKEMARVCLQLAEKHDLPSPDTDPALTARATA